MKINESFARLQKDMPELAFCAFIFLLVAGVVAMIFLFDPRSSFWVRAIGLLGIVGCGAISPSIYRGIDDLD